MKKHLDLWVYSHRTLKKRIMELTIAIIILAVGVSNLLAAPSGTEPQQNIITGIVTDNNGVAIAALMLLSPELRLVHLPILPVNIVLVFHRTQKV